MQRLTLKPPQEARNCKECIYYSSILKYCLKYKVPVEDPNQPPCKPKGYFSYKRLDENTLVGELCINDIKSLNKVIPIKPNIRVGEILDGLEEVGCKPIEVKRVSNVVTIYLSCPCMVRVQLHCDANRCMYKLLKK